MANGDLIKLGTFYLAGTKTLRPTNPWYGTPIGAPSAGNIPVYVKGNSIEIRNTDLADEYQIYWREAIDGGKKVLISDRVLSLSVSWEDLHDQGLVTGKTVTIDNRPYLLRLATVGVNYRGVDGYSGGTPINNEWDRIIINEAGLSGLPTPLSTDLDNVLNATDFNSEHNRFWNWVDAYSWGQEISAANSANRAIRGKNSARFWSSWSGVSQNVGWRPVLEVLHSPPNLSPNINGVYKAYSDGFVKIGGVWRQIDEIHTKINGVWRKS